MVAVMKTRERNHCVGFLVACLLLPGCGLVAPLHEKTLEFALPHVPDTAIRLETANGKIDVARAGGDQVTIVAQLKCVTPERLEAVVVQPVRGENGELSLEIQCPEGKRKSREGCGVSVETPGAQGLDLRTSNGSISVSGLSGLAKIRTSNGRVNVEEHAGSLTARTSNGKVRVKRIQGDVELESSNGSIEACEVSGGVDVETSNGSIEVGLVETGRGPVRARSSNGSVKVDMGGLQGTLEAKTSNGRIQLEGSGGGRMIDQGKKHAVIQFGETAEPRSELRTSNGSITIRQ